MTKRFFFLLLVVYSMSWLKSTAQEIPQRFYYFSEDILVGSGLGLDVGLHYVGASELTLELGYTTYILPSNKPEDFRIHPIIAIISFGLGNPTDWIRTYRASIGKIINLNSAKTIRANLSAGLSYNDHRMVANWSAVPLGEGTNGANYIYENVDESSIGLVLLPKVEFAFSKYVGASVAVNSMLSSKKSTIGLSIGLMIGLVRSKKL
ncbi:hypothetical protein KZP23_05825 [Echinicola marina]|uniref:hypothetical protein n=1 Tax=Echinicola marina TaxID=2859768 RepID=UPI001CF70735|nr:hypothetical protein [Echinicola marina]UCS94538.1 hypothetical protein KZP23_05825 [Echinicola marina]